MKQNYQLVLEKTLKALQAEDKRPSLLLHSCCGPCSSYVMEYLAQYFDITIFYYNPNISPAAEFQFRAEEPATADSGNGSRRVLPPRKI